MASLMSRSMRWSSPNGILARTEDTRHTPMLGLGRTKQLERSRLALREAFWNIRASDFADRSPRSFETTDGSNCVTTSCFRDRWTWSSRISDESR
ncbi:hypothetical protein QC762_0010760 [Podospora pseudocomata]|uniref:Uncharacterized protein n=1 Tax=Podospora pseudocomata TaxID=2093779 RepID=A0ABR0GVK2_9PEZI|nr:hypothetical protein QC762_0010760 [Podospora pseudocomata]